MDLFQVYDLYPIEPVSAQGCRLIDRNGREYLDFYGGHAVISIGHGHPRFVEALTRQIQRLVFYSNSVQNSLQADLAGKLGRLSGYDDYHLFLCNSGAEANENALKLASFHTGRRGVVAFRGAFHGRTSAAVAVTDNPSIRAPVNEGHQVVFLPFGDAAAVEDALSKQAVCAVIIEGIQGVAGVYEPPGGFLSQLRRLCDDTGTVLILDEVQSGYGRTGEFFAHRSSGIRPDLITIAKGMGNGFPVAGVLIHPRFQARPGLLGTTFGGNHLACAAALSVLQVLESENLMDNALQMGRMLLRELPRLSPAIRDVRGRGLMIGVELDRPCKEIRRNLLLKHGIFTGGSSNKQTLRLLPPLCVGRQETERLLEAMQTVLRS